MNHSNKIDCIEKFDRIEIREDGWKKDYKRFNKPERSLGERKEKKFLNKLNVLELIHKAKQEKWESLDLSSCGLTELPPEIGELVDLKKLYISTNGRPNPENPLNNVIRTIPSEIGNLVKLEFFEAHYAGIEMLPDEFSKLKNLRVLSLNFNLFDKFPDVICSLTKLESLAINSRYDSLPDSICNLINLKYLYMPDADITNLPEGIGNLNNLEELCIWGTKIQKLPNSMKRLKNIKSLMLTKSIFQNIVPPEIFQQSPTEVIDYILRYQNDDNKVLLNESKMIIVGQGGVGKTCLLNRIIASEYIEGLSTEGIDITKWDFYYNQKKYKLNIWDFGGQEIYHATHQFFLTKRSLYMFVWDARQEEEYGRIDYWLNTIRSFANDSPIIIVVNKCDISRKNIRRIDINDLMIRFPQIVASYNVSCQDNINIDKLKEEIIAQAQKLPLMETVWFSSWINVRYELEKLAQIKNIISYSEYVEICRRFKIGTFEALSLIKYLHDLGVVLHFHDDMLLKNIVILSPEWGTSAVYKILDSDANILKDRNGILYSEDLPKIWSDTIIYPENIYPYILKLMENFQLSFTIERDQTFLVTELLDSSERTVPLKFERNATLNFRYEYSFLPAGIMTRFIVKTHKYLINSAGEKMCWKKGAYLQYNNAYGLVRLFDGITERYIDIKVSGKNKRNCRELLAIIRSSLEEIHKSIPKIDFTQKVLCNCSHDCKYLHDYKYLNRLESEGIFEERCKTSLKMIDINMLLDGIEIKKGRRDGDKMPEININPVFNNAPIISASVSNSNTNNITIDIKSSINELQGCLNELKDEISDIDPVSTSEFEKISTSIQKLDLAQTKEEIVKSGALNKIRRFLVECGDTESSVGKIVEGVKHGYSVLQEIVEKYNSIAEWCGMPVVPKVFLKKST